MTEDEYRAANPEKIRMYDVRIDTFRDVTKEDILDLVRCCRRFDIPCTGEMTQANYDRLYDACVAAHKKLRGVD